MIRGVLPGTRWWSCSLLRNNRSPWAACLESSCRNHPPPCSIRLLFRRQLRFPPGLQRQFYMCRCRCFPQTSLSQKYYRELSASRCRPCRTTSAVFYQDTPSAHWKKSRRNMSALPAAPDGWLARASMICATRAARPPPKACSGSTIPSGPRNPCRCAIDVFKDDVVLRAGLHRAELDFLDNVRAQAVHQRFPFSARRTDFEAQPRFFR